MLTADLEYAPTPAAVATAVDLIVAACQPHNSIIAFGSRARGGAHSDSGLDLLVLLREPAVSRWALIIHLLTLLGGLRFSHDILVNDLEAYARASKQLNSVYQYIAEEGFPLWQEGRMDLAAIEAVCC